MRLRSQNSLYLAGDGDDIAILYDLEACLGVKIENCEAEKLFTVGDLYDLLTRKIGSDDARRKVCMSAVCYFRLKSALQKELPEVRLSPNFNLQALPTKDSEILRERVFQSTKFLLPTAEIGLAASLAIVALLLGCTALAFAIHPIALIGWPLAYLIAVLSPRRFSNLTLGEFARETASLNFPKLSAEFGVKSNRDVWMVMERAICREIGDTHMDRETTLIAKA